VLEDVAFGMKLRRLLAAFQRLDLGLRGHKLGVESGRPRSQSRARQGPSSS
jgi:hypothetical protein